MEEYVKVFQYFVLVIDVLVIINMVWCVYNNGRSLYNYDYKIPDVPYRAVLLMMSFAFLSANVTALQRHLNTFIFVREYELSAHVVESLLSDRGFMLFTGLCMLMMTLKWTPKWFHKE